MKRIISIVLVAALVLSLAACGSNPRISEYGVEQAKLAVNYMERWLEGTDSDYSLESHLTMIAKNLRENFEKLEKEDPENVYTLYSGDSGIATKLTTIKLEIFNYTAGNGTKAKLTKDVKAAIKYIKKYL